MKKNILFLCTGNSCRSILAEVILNHLGKDRFNAYSAGSFPTGQVNPDSLRILEKHDFPITGLSSQSWLNFPHINFDIVITVCDNAAGEVCPLYLGHAIKSHWGISDPDKIVGKNRENAFEKAFTQLKHRIAQLLELEKITQTNLNDIGIMTP
jgi:arsenate reductase